jgi:exosome complex component RRP42
MIMDEIKAEYVKELLKENKRKDSRDFNAYREIKIENNVLNNAEGSCLASIGNSKVIVGVKIDLMEPFSDRPDEGVLMVNSEFMPLAYYSYSAGPPTPESIELARVVDRGIRAANVLEMQGLKFEDKVLGVFVDFYILDNDGNLTDAATLAVMNALSNLSIPEYNSESKTFNREKRTKKMEVKNRVTTSTFCKINGKILLDCDVEEENASDGSLTIGIADGGFVCSAQKSGSASFSKKEVMDCVDIALQKHGELVNLIKTE